MNSAAPVREFEIIERVFRRVSGRADVVLGIGDDAAVTRLSAGRELVTATDTLVCGTHFAADAPPHSVGYRSLAVNLSDLAAMGADPAWASLAISLPAVDDDWLESFALGFFELADKYDVELIGGDTVRGPLAATVTLQGSVPDGAAVTRGGAQEGDMIYLTGNPGDAVAGRLLLTGELTGKKSPDADTLLTRRFMYPEPRITEGLALRTIATAMIDISDGLHAALTHLLTASGAGAELGVSQLPLSVELLELVGESRASKFALCGGDDYELCFTAPAERAKDIAAMAESRGCPCSQIGTVSAGGKIEWHLHGRHYDVPVDGFRHFE